MKTAIVVYSETGHTLSVAERLMQAYKAKQEDATLFRIESNIHRTMVFHSPTLEGFDHVVIATPVQGFMPAAPMGLFLEQIGTLKGKTVDILLTQAAPWAFFGGTNSLKKIALLIVAKAGLPSKTAIVHWMSKKREQQTNQAIVDLAM